jgi:hypothetical protein
MLVYIGIFFGFLAILFTILLVGLYCIGWFSLGAKVKEFVNKYLSRSFDQ